MTKNHNKKIQITSLALLIGFAQNLAYSFTPVQQPSQTVGAPGNLILPLSVEFPTGLQVSYTSSNFTSTILYDGYFDNRKCYSYSTTNEVFTPVTALNANGTCTSSTQWSGNLLNWLTMTNLDQFRSVMTGGTRDSFSSKAATYPGDTTARTVLIRSFSDRNSYNPLKTLASGGTGVPSSIGALAAGAKTVRSGGFGSKFIVSTTGTFSDLSAADQRVTCAATPLPGAAGTSACFNIRIEACIAVPGVAVEDNCVTYRDPSTNLATAPKPEGLIQKYSAILRFGALGYLNDTGNTRNGAVLRSALKSVGKNNITASGSSANANSEWSDVTGIMANNPDPSDATASGVNNSGVMNYLNKFGYASGYKGNDPVSELYYAALTYLRGVAPPSNYSSGLTTAFKDDFPVITGSNLLAGGSRDPVIMSCQKNFILGLGDIYTHCDGDLPGSTSGMCSGNNPIDAGFNVSSMWSTVNSLEGAGGAGWVGGASNGTPYMAGMAHWANTTDIRPDMPGKQTATTYWVDMLENTNGQSTVAAASRVKSQFWLAAKYGGFRTNLVSGNDPNVNVASWDQNVDGIPDTWFAGSTPAAMKAGLSAAFADIAVRAQAGAGGAPAVSSARQTGAAQVIYTSYDPDGWTGKVTSCSPSQTSDVCNATPIWEASRWFKTTAPTFVATPLTASTRKIITSQPGPTFAKSPFLWGSLTAGQQASLDATDGQGSARVSYIRGDRTDEAAGLFRTRKDTLLGDVVNSGATYVGASGRALTGRAYTGHSAYRTANKTRPPVTYVGANDGMLHAFSATDGKELFGYIPGSLFSTLPNLSAPSFQHTYYVDSTPMVGDFYKSSNAWGTILVGGLGGGGKGYYALDISSQASFAAATEAALASTLPMWEFTPAQDADLGYTFNEPAIQPITALNLQINKTVNASGTAGQWNVIVGNGFGSTAGKAALYFLNADTGTVQTKLTADAGPNNGLATPVPVDTDYDGLVDTVYAGDLLGNLHKFQFAKPDTVNVGDYILAPAGDALGTWRYIGILYASGEPITTAPGAIRACGDGSIQGGASPLAVSFGTGKLNELDDYTDTAARSFVTIFDNQRSSSLTVPASKLANINYSTATSGSEVVRTWPAPSMVGKSGWKMSFTAGERVLSNPGYPADSSSVLIGTTKPGGDVCTPTNSGFLNSVNLCTGAIGGLIVNSTLVGGLSLGSTSIVKVGNSYLDSNNRSITTTNQDKTKGGIVSSSNQAAPKGRYSWREILTK